MTGGKEVTEEQLMEMLRSQVGNTGNIDKYWETLETGKGHQWKLLLVLSWAECSEYSKILNTQLGEMGLAEMEALLKQGMTPQQVRILENCLAPSQALTRSWSTS